MGASPNNNGPAEGQKETQEQHHGTSSAAADGGEKPEFKSKSAKFASELRVAKPVAQRSMSAKTTSPSTIEGYIGTLRMENFAPPIVIRKARPSDVDEIITFAQPAYMRDPLRADLLAGSKLKEVKKTDYNHCKSMLLDLFDGTRVILVGETRDRSGRKRLISCFQLYRQSKAAAYFGMFAVHPFFQASGLGKRLLTVAERYARIVWGSDEMQLDVGGSLSELKAGMGRLQRYYKRRGFRSTGILRPFTGAVSRFITVDRNDLWIEIMVKDIRGALDDIGGDPEKRMKRVNSRGRLAREADKDEGGGRDPQKRMERVRSFGRLVIEADKVDGGRDVQKRMERVRSMGRFASEADKSDESKGKDGEEKKKTTQAEGEESKGKDGEEKKKTTQAEEQEKIKPLAD
ncbi:hypothetical protein niasHT_014223 [Heterodera trifolii]|uniref:N-acetyltransferase domain-containing protein n=1 Tax=Heterodera trifolii TaxID=157864 RepID=A0ABD2KX55_9BILA